MTKMTMISTLALALGLGFAAQASPGVQKLRCGRVNGQFERCEVPTPITGARLVVERGSEKCVLGTNWGFDSWGVWTVGECRGTFLAIEGSPSEAPVVPGDSVVSEVSRTTESFKLSQGRADSQRLRCDGAGFHVANYSVSGKALCSWEVAERVAIVTCVGTEDERTEVTATLTCRK